MSANRIHAAMQAAAQERRRQLGLAMEATEAECATAEVREFLSSKILKFLRSTQTVSPFNPAQLRGVRRTRRYKVASRKNAKKEPENGVEQKCCRDPYCEN